MLTALHRTDDANVIVVTVWIQEFLKDLLSFEIGPFSLCMYVYHKLSSYRKILDTLIQSRKTLELLGRGL